MHYADNGYEDDSGQLPELPDPGPRDGRHGVDRDEDYDPYPARRTGTARGPLTVSLEDAKRHLALLVARVEAGDEVVLTRNGHPVARIVPPDSMLRVTVVDEAVVSEAVVDEMVIDALGTGSARVAATVQTRTKVYDHADQLPELPDSGPRDGRHGVDRDRGYKPFGRA